MWIPIASRILKFVVRFTKETKRVSFVVVFVESLLKILSCIGLRLEIEFSDGSFSKNLFTRKQHHMISPRFRMILFTDWNLNFCSDAVLLGDQIRGVVRLSKGENILWNPFTWKASRFHNVVFVIASNQWKLPIRFPISTAFLRTAWVPIGK